MHDAMLYTVNARLTLYTRNHQKKNILGRGKFRKLDEFSFEGRSRNRNVFTGKTHFSILIIKVKMEPRSEAAVDSNSDRVEKRRKIDVPVDSVDETQPLEQKNIQESVTHSVGRLVEDVLAKLEPELLKLDSMVAESVRCLQDARTYASLATRISSHQDQVSGTNPIQNPHDAV